MWRLGVLLLLVCSLQGAITQLTTRSFGMATSPTTSSTVDTTGATLCVASFSDGVTTATYTPTDSKGNTWHPLTIVNAGSQGRTQLWYAWDHGGTPFSAGTGHTFTGATTVGGNPWVVFTCYSGTQTTSDPFDQQNTGTTGASVATSVQPGSVTPTSANQLLVTSVSGYVEPTGFTISPGSFTITAQSGLLGGTNYAGAQAYLVETTATTQNPTWTLATVANQAMTAAIATFKAGATTSSLIKHRSTQGQ